MQTQHVYGGSGDLEVAAIWLSPFTGGSPILGISVANKSSQPVEVAEVGFLIPGGQRLCALNALKGGGQLPQVLQPGVTITVPLDPRILTAPSLRDAECAYAKTVDKRNITGSALRPRELAGG